MGNESVRDEKGRFKPGYSGGPGRPKKAVEDAYLNAILDALPPEELTALIRKLREEDGWRPKAFAAELVAHYGLGKPVQRVYTTGFDFGDMVDSLRDKPSHSNP